jgi:hypothetical protein
MPESYQNVQEGAERDYSRICERISFGLSEKLKGRVQWY